MALPTTISGIQNADVKGDSAPRISPTTGAVYVLGVNTTSPNTLRMMKSTDVTSSFSAQDDSNAPALGTAAAVKSFSVFQVGDMLHIATWSTVAPEVRYHTFNMASGTDGWVTKNETVETLTNVPSDGRTVDIVVLPNGEQRIQYGGSYDVL